MNEAERELLDRAREALGPTPAQRAALRGRIDAALASSGGAAPAGGSLPLVAIVGALVLAGVGAWLSREEPEAVSRPEPVTELSAPVVEPVPEPVVEAAAVPEPMIVPVEVAPVAEPRRAASGAARGAPVAPMPSSSALPEDDHLAEELALVSEARRAIARGDAAAARVALDRHASAFPEGLLAEERSALAVLALCAAGEEDRAVASARAFLARYPASVSASRIRASCAGPALAP